MLILAIPSAKLQWQTYFWEKLLNYEQVFTQAFAHWQIKFTSTSPYQSKRIV